MTASAAEQLALLRYLRAKARQSMKGSRKAGDKNWEDAKYLAARIADTRLEMIKRSFLNKTGKDIQEIFVDLSREGIYIEKSVKIDPATGKIQKIDFEVPAGRLQKDIWLDIYQSLCRMELARARKFARKPGILEPRKQFLRDRKTIFNHLQDVHRKTRRGK